MKKYLGSLAAAPCLFVFLLLSGCAGSSSNTAATTTPPTPQATAPAISSISPAAIPVGAAATTLTVNGTGFTTSTTVQVNGIVETTTYVSATQVSAVIPAGQLATGALLHVSALNGTVASASVNLEVDNPSPTVAQFSPAFVATGSGPTTVAVTGTGFLPSTTIQAGSAARATTYVSATQVNVTLTAVDFTTATPLALIAVNPTPGGGSSPAASLPINNPTPVISQLTPASITAGSAATTVTLTGTGFLPTTVLRINGISAQPPTSAPLNLPRPFRQPTWLPQPAPPSLPSRSLQAVAAPMPSRFPSPTPYPPSPCSLPLPSAQAPPPPLSL